MPGKPAGRAGNTFVPLHTVPLGLRSNPAVSYHLSASGTTTASRDAARWPSRPDRKTTMPYAPLPRALRPLSAAVAVATAVLLAGCAVGPDYHRPDTSIPAAYKEAPAGWKVAQPADRTDRGIGDKHVEDRTDRQRADQSDGDVAVRIAGFFGGGGYGVEADIGKED